MKTNLKCNTPVPSWRKGKKFAVLACDTDEQKLIHFGAKNYSDFTQHKDKKRRANFRARHRCDSDPPKKTSARSWSCEYLWGKK
jgi:hypothetical protein